MSYATFDDAVDKYGEDYVLTSVTRDSKPDKKAFDRALVNATSEIDSWIGGRYTVPLAEPIPDIVVGFCVDIAIYKASADPGTHTEEKRNRYDDAKSWMKAVSEGKASIQSVNEDGNESDKNDTDVPQISAGRRLFTRRTMRGLA